MSILANLLSAGSLAQNLLYNLVYDVGKAGVKKVFRLDSDEETKTAILTELSQIKGNNKKIEMMLGQVFFQQEVIAAYLIALTKELGMGTTVQFKDGHLAVEIPPEDKAFQKKLEGAAPISPLRIAEHPEVVSALGLKEDTVLDMVAELDNLKFDVEALAEKIKNVVITPQNTVEPNKIFDEVLERKTNQEAIAVIQYMMLGLNSGS